jgi:hypothetical protein
VSAVPAHREPPGATIGGLPPRPPCPFCDGHDTELVNAFGSHASVSTYWCRSCRSPFELLKWRGAAGGAAPAAPPPPAPPEGSE